MPSSLFYWVSQSSLLSDFEKGLKEARIKFDNLQLKSLLILSCSGNHYSEKEVSTLLSEVEFPVFGGIYPMLINQNKVLDKGVMMIGFDHVIPICELTLNESDEDPLLIFQQHLIENKFLENSTDFFMFYDGLMPGTETFVDDLYEILTHDIKIMGGGAGSLDFLPFPCVYSNSGLLSNTIQLAALPFDLNISAGHGWETLEGPFLVSESEGHTVESLNYSPAFELYKTTVESLSPFRFNEHDFFDIAKHFPLGIESVNGEMLVRDPILANGEFIQCVGNVPVNSMVYILKGNKCNLIESAAQAARKAKNLETKSIYNSCMVFDCISRVLYLEDDFEDEINGILKESNVEQMFGVLSIGEITNNDGQAIRLLNKSTVIGCF